MSSERSRVELNPGSSKTAVSMNRELSEQLLLFNRLDPMSSEGIGAIELELSKEASLFCPVLIEAEDRFNPVFPKDAVQLNIAFWKTAVLLNSAPLKSAMLKPVNRASLKLAGPLNSALVKSAPSKLTFSNPAFPLNSAL